MEQHVRCVMPAGVHAVDLRVEHVRNPGQRMPVAGVESRERPGDILPAQPGLNVRVLPDIIRVIEMNELKRDHRVIGRGDDRGEENADPEDTCRRSGPEVSASQILASSVGRHWLTRRWIVRIHRRRKAVASAPLLPRPGPDPTTDGAKP